MVPLIQSLLLNECIDFHIHMQPYSRNTPSKLSGTVSFSGGLAIDYIAFTGNQASLTVHILP